MSQFSFFFLFPLSFPSSNKADDKKELPRKRELIEWEARCSYTGQFVMTLLLDTWTWSRDLRQNTFCRRYSCSQYLHTLFCAQKIHYEMMRIVAIGNYCRLKELVQQRRREKERGHARVRKRNKNNLSSLERAFSYVRVFVYVEGRFHVIKLSRHLVQPFSCREVYVLFGNTIIFSIFIGLY